jgi:large subunit ribosomal protein L18
MRRHGPHYRVPFRRRREGRTDYRKRLQLLRAHAPRAVVRKTNAGVIVQVCAYSDRGDQVLAGAVAQELRKLGWTGSTGNLPAAYLTGFLAGKRAAAKGVTAAVLDLGRQHPTKGGRLFAVLKGLLDAGVDIPHDAGVLPDPERVQGAHLGGDAAQRFAATKSKVEAG